MNQDNLGKSELRLSRLLNRDRRIASRVGLSEVMTDRREEERCTEQRNVSEVLQRL